MTLEPTRKNDFSQPGRVTTGTSRPPQTAAAIATRTLLSLGLIALSAAAFRLSLQPASDSANTSLLKQEVALAGAPSARLALNAGWVDLKVDAADLPGVALAGRLKLPIRDKLIATSPPKEEVGASLSRTYTVGSGAAEAESAEPWRLGWNIHGVQRDTPAADRLGLWTVRIGQDVPSELLFSSSSGSLSLNLSGVKLKGLNVSTRSGDTRLTLPAALSAPDQSPPGPVSLRSFSGDLAVTSEKSDPPPAAQGHATASTFKAQSESGDQKLDLQGTAYSNVVVGSSTGNIELTTPAATQLVAAVTTLSGHQTVTVPARVKRASLTLRSTMGDLEVRLPAGAAVRVTVSTRLGDISVPDGYTKQGDTYLSPSALALIVRQPDAPIDIIASTPSGDVTIDEASK